MLANDLYKALVNHPRSPAAAGSAVQSGAAGSVLRHRRREGRHRALDPRSPGPGEADAALALARPDFRTAESAARRGIEALSEVAPSSEMRAVYADLLFDLGQAQLIQAKAADANQAFTLAHRLDPTKQPDPARYLPEIIDAYNATVPKPGPTAKLLVKGMGRVWIDGIEQRFAANNMFEVDEGLHLVQLTGPDREPRGELVRVPQTSQIEDRAGARDRGPQGQAGAQLARADDGLGLACERAPAARPAAARQRCGRDSEVAGEQATRPDVAPSRARVLGDQGAQQRAAARSARAPRAGEEERADRPRAR